MRCSPRQKAWLGAAAGVVMFASASAFAMEVVRPPIAVYAGSGIGGLAAGIRTLRLLRRARPSCAIPSAEERVLRGLAYVSIAAIWPWVAIAGVFALVAIFRMQ